MKDSYQKQQKKLVEQIAKTVREGQKISSTVIGMRDDYENDPGVCLAALAIPSQQLVAEIKEKLIEPLRKIQPEHYYLPDESLHLTIKSIRNSSYPPTFDDEDIAKVVEKFAEIVPSKESFSFEMKGLLRLPTSISLMGYSDERLFDLVSALDEGLKEIGVPDDKKYVSDKVFFGNMNFCRFTVEPSEAFLEKIEELSEVELGTFEIKEFKLVQCNMVFNLATRKIIETFKLAD